MNKKRRQERKKKARQERIRREKHQRHSQPSVPADDFIEEYADDEECADDGGGADGMPDSLPPLPSRLVGERALRDLHAAIAAQGFQTDEELQAFLAEYNASPPSDLLAGKRVLDPREEAQDLAYEAMEAKNSGDARRLARQALAIDPDCVDALVKLASLEASAPAEFVSLLEKAVAAGERALGPAFFADNAGHFWGMLETRPYMRARADLANALQQMGRIADAIGHYEVLLRLNPNDNQGNRDALLGCYLEIGDVAGARRLFEQYPENYFAIYNWGRVLERLLSGAAEEAVLARREAMDQNRFVEAYLTGRKLLPRRLPEAFSPGTEAEALYCASNLGQAWSRHPFAQEWLTKISQKKEDRRQKTE